MTLHIALAGNPNSGKTTLFNALTGAQQYVGNWPGVTVERKEGRLKGHPDVIIQDLPGVYSLSPYTQEEVITRRYLVEDSPQAIINIVDGSNIERNLYLSTQLLEIGIPVVVAVNMMDVVRKRGDRLDLAALSRDLGVPVLALSALSGEGVEALKQAVMQAAQRGAAPKPLPIFSDDVERALAHIGEVVRRRQADSQHASGAAHQGRQRWHALKLFEGDEQVREALGLDDSAMTTIRLEVQACEEQLDDDGQGIVTSQRYDYIEGLMKRTAKLKRKPGQLSPSDRIDLVVTNRWLGFPIFMAVMLLVYVVSVTSIGAMVTDFTNETLFGEWILGGLTTWLPAVGTADWLQGLLVEGIVGGVGAVLGFVPQMFVLFFFLAVLEDIGYLARVAFIMDRVFRRFGLSGKSFIPMLIGSGCSVPGIMASRTIENRRDRHMTIITTSFIPCSAKLPIIALIAGTMFGGAWWLGPLAYFIGVAAVIVSGIILKKTRRFQGEPAPFVMELPAYHVPKMGNVLRSMWERGFSFIKRAGTIILLSAIIIWFLKAFGVVDGRLEMITDMDHSMLAFLGGLVAPLFSPLGFGSWQSSVATVLGLVAKEEVVSVFGVLYGVTGDALALVEDGAFELLSPIAAHFTGLSAISFLVFNLLCAPCFAAIGAMHREFNNWRWTLFALGYQTAMAYGVSLIIYQLGIIGSQGFGPGSALAIALALGIVYLLVRPASRRGKWRTAALRGGLMA